MSQLWNPAKSVLENLPDDFKSKLSLDTKAIATRHVHPGTEPLVPPITHSSTYLMTSVDDYLRILKESGYTYGRLGTPNSDAVECAINALEEGAGTLVFGSGTAAICAALICFLKAEDHVVCQNHCYSATYDMLDEILAKFGVETSWVPAGCSVEEYRKKIKPNTKLLYGETPFNPTLTILDLQEFGQLGASEGIITIVDGTFASPFCQQSLKFGIDISMHSCTKYLGGHSDLMAGCLTFKKAEHWKMMKRYQSTLGMQLSPHDASLLLRAIKTIHVRMPRHASNAMKIAAFLEKHPKVEFARFPGLESHPQHALAKKQMTCYSGMIAVEIKGGIDCAKAFAENLHLAQLAVSLGDVETLVEHPATMTHGPMIMSDEEREECGITPGMVRLSIGLEDPDDLIRDFQQALDKVNA
ncbi:L-methionine gamma-lyase-like [Mercenaria mercenaria]|uniref:L-methionine gamma-lyase-like n=1 Tax=Mercenaria mercenaria TaxID=6596 RepID=UPI00234F84EB|nr:L-methionine gamma-lyase-like [Mercenaria mercenaria]